MPSGTLNRAAALSVLKDRYLPDNDLWESFNTGAPLMDALEAGNGFPKLAAMDAEGYRIRIPLWTSGNPNASVPVPESGGYPRPGYQGRSEADFNIGTFVQSFSITGLEKAISRGGASSVVRDFDWEMEKQPVNARVRMNQALHGDGSGILGTITGGTLASGIVQMDSTVDMTQFAVGQEVQIRELLDATTVYAGYPLNLAYVISAITASTRLITLVTEAGAAVNLSGTAGTGTGTAVPTDGTAGLYLFNTHGGANGTAFDMFGLGVMCSDSNPVTWGVAQTNALYGNISRSVAGNEFWQANRINASNAPFSLTRHVQVMHRTIEQRTGAVWGGPMMCVLWHPHFYSVANEMERDRRTGPTVLTKRGNWPLVQYDNAWFLRDHMAPRTVARWIRPRATYRYIMTPWGWEDETGSTMERMSTSTGRPTNSFRLNMLSRQQLLSTQCFGNGEVYGLPSISA